MKFIKVYQQNGKDFFIINSANISHLMVNNKSGTCQVVMNNKDRLTLFPQHASKLLTELSELNNRLTIIEDNYTTTEEDF